MTETSSYVYFLSVSDEKYSTLTRCLSEEYDTNVTLTCTKGSSIHVKECLVGRLLVKADNSPALDGICDLTIDTCTYNDNILVQRFLKECQMQTSCHYSFHPAQLNLIPACGTSHVGAAFYNVTFGCLPRKYIPIISHICRLQNGKT